MYARPPTRLELEWRRVPVALRLALIVGATHHLLEVFANGWLTLSLTLNALGAGSRVLALVGALVLARRSPSAAAIVIAYALMAVMWIVPVVLQGALAHSESGWKIINYLWVALDLVLVIAWALPSGPPVWRLIGAALGAASFLPMILHGSLDYSGSDSFGARLYDLGIEAAIAVVRLLVAMGVPFSRPQPVTASGRGHYVAIAAAMFATLAGIAAALAWVEVDQLAAIARLGAFIIAVGTTTFGALLACLRDHRGATTWLFAFAGLAATTAASLGSFFGVWEVSSISVHFDEWISHRYFIAALAMEGAAVLAVMSVLQLARATRTKVAESLGAVVVVSICAIACCATAWTLPPLSGATIPLASLAMSFAVTAIATLSMRRAIDPGLPVAKINP